MSADAPSLNAAVPPRYHAAAIWSLVLGILSIGCLWIVGSIPAIILGIVALRRIDAAEPPLQGKGLAIAGIVTGGIGVFTGIFVIGIFASILFPAFSGAMQRAERAHAESTAYHVKNAISAYFTEYRHYPVREAAGDVTLDTDEELMDVLLGSDSQAGADGLNPRRIVLYTDRQAKPDGHGGFRGGVTLDAAGGGILLDPWGRPYRVRLDTDYDNRVENPDPDDPERILPESILVWSAGPDGDFDTWEDNVKTW